jgi:hypothetical protein
MGGKIATILSAGCEHLLKRKGIIVHRKEGTRVLSLKNRGFGVYSMNKKWVGGKYS